MIQLFRDSLISIACVLKGRKKLQLCKGHPSLCVTPSQELHGLAVERRVALWRIGVCWVGYLPTTVLSTLLGADILGVQDSPLCSAEQRKHSTFPMCGITLAHTGKTGKNVQHVMSVAALVDSVVKGKGTGKDTYNAGKKTLTNNAR